MIATDWEMWRLRSKPNLEVVDMNRQVPAEGHRLLNGMAYISAVKWVRT